ncbi:DUF3868 domain-containing protein [Dysgonomonas sp. ZJ279]|uniref:DUF3868 domain-containing protein n=1 Tax=Dysgonomonas sp. ZJ279 TaxID=2709796 RepID=UPI0013E9E282
MNPLINVEESKKKKKGKSLQIDLDINIPYIPIGENESMMLIPTLTEGKHKQELPYILINGSERHKGYKKLVRSLGEEAIHSGYKLYKAFDAEKDLNHSHSYSVQVEYEDWMSDAEVNFTKF